MQNENSVCFVAKVDEITSIPGADKIEQIYINGWSCVSQKGIYEVNQKVVCNTTDAVIPTDLAEKLEVTNYLRKGTRVRTVKLRGVYSECLLFKPETVGLDPNELNDGDDLMEELEIFKYEPPEKFVQITLPKVYFEWKKFYSYKMWKKWVNYKLHQKRNKGKRESNNFHVYHKFPNIKNVPHIFNEEDDVVITRKLHGTNARYGICKKMNLTWLEKLKEKFGMLDEWSNYEFVYGSHRVQKGSDTNGFYSTDVWKEISDKYQIKEKLWKYVKDNYSPGVIGIGFELYGEIYGAGIQKGYSYGLEDIKFAAFDIEMDGIYVSGYFFVGECSGMGIPTVPELYAGKWSKEIQNYWVDQNIEGTKTPHEGIVIKHQSGDRRKIAKLINSDYLIFAEKHNVEDSH
jgi:hypothetical protein